MRVYSLLVQTMVEALTADSIDGALALKRAGGGLPEKLSEQPWVPMAVWDQLLIQAATLSPDPAYGLVNGTSVAWARLAPFAMLALNAPSLRHILRDLMRFQPLLSDQNETLLVEAWGHAWLRLQPLAIDPRARVFRAESTVMGLVILLRLIGARAEDIIRINFDYPAPAHAQRYDIELGAPVFFGQPDIAIQFAPRLLDAVLPGRDQALYAVIRGRAETALSALRAPHGDVAYEVRRWLISTLPRTPGMDEAAAQLGISKRSLRRELYRVNIKFNQLLQDCQRVQAEELIARGDMSFDQVAQASGFTSKAAFFRAFRRWTDMTPTDWRIHHLRTAAPRDQTVPQAPG